MFPSVRTKRDAAAKAESKIRTIFQSEMENKELMELINEGRISDQPIETRRMSRDKDNYHTHFESTKVGINPNTSQTDFLVDSTSEKSLEWTQFGKKRRQEEEEEEQYQERYQKRRAERMIHSGKAMYLSQRMSYRMISQSPTFGSQMYAKRSPLVACKLSFSDHDICHVKFKMRRRRILATSSMGA